MTRAISIIVALCCCTAVNAGAQTFSGLNLTGHPTLYVTGVDGRETRGKLATLRDDALTLQLKNAMKTFVPQEVALVERRGDSLRNGAIAGAVIAGVCMFTCLQGVSSGGQLAKVALTNAVIPVAIDALYRGRTRIWPPRKP
jgi:hypothetical protein